LQEYMAAALGLQVGYYAQISSNFHIYTEFDITKRLLGKVDPHPVNPYEATVSASPHPILEDAFSINDWQEEAATFIDVFTDDSHDPHAESIKWTCPFFAKVAVPMYRAWHAMVKQKDTEKAWGIAQGIVASDWRMAAIQWIVARAHARADKRTNGS
jgi:hypothetical protein